MASQLKLSDGVKAELIDRMSRAFPGAEGDLRNPSRQVLYRTWFRNILYYLGEQWISWFESTGKFGKRYNVTAGLPTPVSNIIKDYVRSMKALTLNKKYVTSVWPNSDEQGDKDAAKIGKEIIRHLDSQRDGQGSGRTLAHNHRERICTGND
jgi:hypothetical protein